MDDLGPNDFTIKGRRYIRKDISLTNTRGDSIWWSHFQPPKTERINKVLPCVVYCHGNCGSRIDSLPLLVALLPHNITIFSFDFTGSGRSDGDYVSLGWYEKEDLKIVVEYLHSLDSVSGIGLWGQSMGAVTSLMYAAEDHSIAGLVLDSPYSNLYKLCQELWKRRSKIPLFVCKLVLKLMRKSILKKAGFDLTKLDTLAFAQKCFSPCKFFYPDKDDFVDPKHSKKLFGVYSGEKSINEFKGNHNTERPDFFYDSAAIFFHNVLMCDEIKKKQTIKVDKALHEKIPEFDSTCFKNLGGELENEENSEWEKFDDRIKFIQKVNRKEELKQSIQHEEPEIQKAILQSMVTYTEECQKDTDVIDVLNKIGVFQDMQIVEEVINDQKAKIEKANDMNWEDIDFISKESELMSRLSNLDSQQSDLISHEGSIVTKEDSKEDDSVKYDIPNLKKKKSSRRRRRDKAKTERVTTVPKSDLPKPPVQQSKDKPIMKKPLK